MSGRSGSRTAAHTPLIHIGEQTYSASQHQRAMLDRALKAGGCIHVIGPEVRTAKSLARRGYVELRDDGSFGPKKGSSNIDGERWTLRVKDGVR